MACAIQCKGGTLCRGSDAVNSQLIHDFRGTRAGIRCNGKKFGFVICQTGLYGSQFQRTRTVSIGQYFGGNSKTGGVDKPDQLVQHIQIGFVGIDIILKFICSTGRIQIKRICAGTHRQCIVF